MECGLIGLQGVGKTTLFEALTLGYLAWIPRDGEPGFVSEDSEPVYSQGTTHRARIALVQHFGGLTIDGRLDIAVAADATEKIQYLAVTMVQYRFSVPLDGSHQPAD